MRILVVESDLEIAGAIQAMLERRKFRVHVVTDGDGGLDALLDASYDAAVVDLVLPRRDGFAIPRSAQPRNSHASADPCQA